MKTTTGPYVCLVALHQERGKTAKRNLWMNVQPRSNSLPSWERRFKAFFDILRGENRVPLDQVLAWLRKQGFKIVDFENHLTSEEYSITMLITADEFLEITYERSLKIPRIRTLREIRYSEY